jgi:hypothetical protein
MFILMLDHKALVEFPEFRSFDDPEWPFQALIQLILKSSSDTHRKLKRKALAEDEAKELVEELVQDLSMTAITPGKFTYNKLT